MNNIREQSFWKLISKLDELNLLQHIMIMGSWAEYLYTQLFDETYIGNIETRDIDILYLNINKPINSIPLITTLKDINYIYTEDPYTGVAKFQNENILELEFLTRALGSGSKTITKIPPLGIKSESLRIINILEQYPRYINTKGFTITVPEPSVYVIQKILTNPTRTPAWKKPKDIASCNKLLKYINDNEYDRNMFCEIYDNLSKKQKQTFYKVIQENNLVLADFIINKEDSLPNSDDWLSLDDF